MSAQRPRSPGFTALRSPFDWKVRGFRVVEIIGAVMLAAIVVSVYYAKAEAARQGAEIDHLQRTIAAERSRVRLLTAEAARLEEPARLEALSRRIGLEPGAGRRLSLDELPTLAPVAEPEAPTTSVAAPGDEGAAP